jgi:hypothetical protein
MKRQSFQDILDRVHTWPKEAQEAAFDVLTSVEEGLYDGPSIAEDIIRSRDDIR